MQECGCLESILLKFQVIKLIAFTGRHSLYALLNEDSNQRIIATSVTTRAVFFYNRVLKLFL